MPHNKRVSRYFKENSCQRNISRFAARAHPLRRTNQREAAADANKRPLDLCGHSADRAYLQRLDETPNFLA
jgi:hypothetical protein